MPTLAGSSGSPIILRIDYSIIGLHFGSESIIENNKNIIINYSPSISSIIQDILIKIKSIPPILNNYNINKIVNYKNNNNIIYKHNNFNNNNNFINNNERKGNNEINNLKLKIQNNKIICDLNDVIVIKFISTDFKIHEGIKCLADETFAKVEERLYQKFDEFRNTDNAFLFKGKKILRFKKIRENRINDGDIIQLFKKDD